MMTMLIELSLCARTVLSMGPESSTHCKQPYEVGISYSHLWDGGECQGRKRTQSTSHSYVSKC